jgi:hypothetical protein
MYACGVPTEAVLKQFKTPHTAIPTFFLHTCKLFGTNIFVKIEKRFGSELYAIGGVI